MCTLNSERLELIPLPPAFLRFSLAGKRTEAQAILGVPLPADWPHATIADVLALRLRQLELEPSLQPWLLRAMILKSERAIVGHIGFHTGPGPEYLRSFSPGGIEFGFTTFEPYRRSGYAREASLTLMRWAYQTHGITRFVLSIRPDNLPSQRLAAQLGFVKIGSHLDEVDGIEDVLERLADPSSVPGAKPVGHSSP